MVFAEIEGQLRTEGGWNMHIAIALIMALLVTAGVLWFFFAPRKAYRAPLRDGVQEAVVEVKGGYNPAVIEAEAGMPLRLIFDRGRKTANARRMSCSPISGSILRCPPSARPR